MTYDNGVPDDAKENVHIDVYYLSLSSLSVVLSALVVVGSVLLTTADSVRCTWRLTRMHDPA